MDTPFVKLVPVIRNNVHTSLDQLVPVIAGESNVPPAHIGPEGSLRVCLSDEQVQMIVGQILAALQKSEPK